MGIVIFWLSLLQQIVLYSWYLIETSINISESLPFHICRISTVLGIIYLMNQENLLMDSVFYFGLIACGPFSKYARSYLCTIINRLYSIYILFRIQSSESLDSDSRKERNSLIIKII